MPPNAKARLTEDGNRSIFLEFDFNPVDLKIVWGSTNTSYTLVHGTDSALAAAYEPMRLNTAAPMELHLGTVQFRGPSTWSKLVQLRKWYEPDQGTRQGSGGQVSWTRPPLIFSWGADGVRTDVELFSLSMTVTRFAPEGGPIAATATITLHALSEQLTATNPTSGGLSGRHTTTMVQGQNLQAIALDSYGSAAHWRDVARLNRIEDPLRVRPGDVVYLPNRDELRSGGAA